jgi:hypothetical protein
MSEPLTLAGCPDHGPPDPLTHVCCECGRTFPVPAFEKCPSCLAIDGLPLSLIQFGELVKPAGPAFVEES